MNLPIYEGLSEEASYRYDERLAIMGCYNEPTKAQHEIAWTEAINFDRETIRRKIAMGAKATNQK